MSLLGIHQGLGVAAVLFIVAAAMDWLGHSRGYAPWSTASRWIIRASFVFLTANLVSLGFAGFSSTAGILTVLAWGIAGLALFLDLTFNHRFPGWAIGALVGVGLLVASLLRPTAGNMQPWITLHVAAVVLAYCMLIAQALNSALYLLQDRALSARRFGGIYSLLPALVPLDRISNQLLGAAVWMLGVALTVGTVAWLQGADKVTLIKLIASGVAWTASVSVLILRRQGLLSGTSFARASLIAFIPACVAFVLSLPSSAS